MSILHGPQAIEAAKGLLQTSRLCAVSCDPQANPQLPPRLLVFANGASACAIDVASCGAALQSLWQFPCAYGSAQAKRLHQTLQGAGYRAPERWACAQINEQLLAASRWPTNNATQGALPHQRFKLQPPDPQASIENLIDCTHILWRLLVLQGQALNQQGMQHVARIEARAVAPIAEMEQRGMPFDAIRFRDVVHDDLLAQQALQHEIAQTLGLPVAQLGDPHRLRAALHAQGYNVANVGRDALAQLPAPLGTQLSRLRQLTHNLQAYGDDFAKHARDGRIYATFSQIGSTTGRMACHNPNLQAITQEPRRRSCFAAPAGHKLVIADYNACELRILAHMSADPAFCQAFLEGTDVHRQIATQIFGHAASEKQQQQHRQIAKVVSFGLIYGMGTQSLARTLKVSPAQADELQRRYFQRFSQVRAYLLDSQAQARQHGFAQTLSHRRLALPMQSQDRAEMASTQRIARNMPIQGTGADILKIALARLRQALPGHPKLGTVHCVHDEIVVETHHHDATQTAQLLQQHMKAAASELVTRVPMQVETQIRDQWSHQK